MKQIMDGCTAATHIAYALSEVATIYPITPIASMGDTADRWALAGRQNVFGSTVQIRELESELGAAGATHGALAGGALATTFTSSQGLLLMIPNMFKISGELLPAVFHVGSRSIATQALSIFGDHQDVMACRTTGFAILASATVQETMDLALCAHLAAIEGRVPVLHFFDGWRTSNEWNTIDVIDYDTIAAMVDRDAVAAFRARAMNPRHPDTRGSAQNSDVYFQNREAANRYYDAFPAIMQKAMDKVSAATGRAYHLFDYYGAPDADRVAVAMGSSTAVLRDAVDCLNARGEKTGVLSVRLYRPFDAAAFIAAMPESVKHIIVLDRTKEPGSQAEPLLLDVIAAVHDNGLTASVTGGRYGLSSKDFDPVMAAQVFAEAASAEPKRRFTVGITDDVTHLSLDVTAGASAPAEDGVTQCVFYGMGSDGTVGATRQAASVIADEDSMYAQAYFHYSAKKSGGYTISELRFGPHPIHSEYSIRQADYTACNKDAYVGRFALAERAKAGSIFVLNTAMTDAQLDKVLPPALRRDIAAKKLQFYTIDATAIAAKVGLGARINTIMEAVFFHLINAVDIGKALEALRDRVKAAYMHEGGDVVQKNLAAIDMAAQAIHRVAYPESWAQTAVPPRTDSPTAGESATDSFVRRIARPCTSLKGDSLPVSAFTPDGTIPPGTTAWEKRCIAIEVPQWNPAKCVQCTECSLVCSHAAIRPVLMTPAEKDAAPEGFDSIPTSYKALKGKYFFRIQVYASDCTGCGSCATICPGKALDMRPLDTQLDKQERMLAYAQTVAEKDTLMPLTSIPGTQLRRPLLQFSGACGGCGETPYVKLLTQLFGQRMVIANATGCSSIWGANYPSNAYCTDANGCGPAWANSLFEDNAEFGYGIAVAMDHRREVLLDTARKAVAGKTLDAQTEAAVKAWIAAFDDAETSQATADVMVSTIGHSDNPLLSTLVDNADMLGKKSVWAIGGDGWAYDIGFAGLDHVLAQNININLLVMDTECYSNTGGQTSKATPLGAVIKYAAHGKRTRKKDLGRMMMTYGNVYVAQIALGANYSQAIEALREAEAYDGPSIVIAYCPCILHGIRTGMSHSIVEERRAVEAGYWQLYRYNPADGKLSLDMPAPDGSLSDFLQGEDRYADLRIADPADAPALDRQLADRLGEIYSVLSSLSSQQGA